MTSPERGTAYRKRERGVPPWLPQLIKALCILGLIVSAYLTWEAFSGGSTLACPEGETINCAKVTESEWSKLFGIPVAPLGLLFFAGMWWLATPARLRDVRPVWDRLRLLPGQQRQVYDWLRIHGHRVLTGDSFFHLSGYGDPLPGLSGCGAGRVVCLVDPIGDVYACPFAIHDRFRAGNVTTDGGLAQVWRSAPAFAALRDASAGPECRGCAAYQDCRGGCPAAKFFTGLAPEAPDPECVQGRAAQRLAASQDRPTHGIDHSRRTSLAVLADSPCDQSPLQGFLPELFPPDPS